MGRGVVSTPICANNVRREVVLQVPTILRQSSCRVHSMSRICPPTSPYPTFLLAQKWIAPTDIVQLKSDDTKWCHW